MGIHHIKKCHITGLDTENYFSNLDLAEYLIQINNKRILFRFLCDHKNSEFVEANKYILYGLLLNEKFPSEYNGNNSKVLNNEILERIILESDIPKSPNEKLEKLLTYLHSLQEFEGAEIEFPEHETREDLAKRLYFKNSDEMTFYLFTLLNMGYISGSDASTIDGDDLINIRITYSGLAQVAEISNSGKTSDRCFVAMSFSKGLVDIRNAIKEAITQTGFSPVLIDEIHFESELTINDAIIGEIKKCKFLVADFSEHKHGVYFESGFALGLKKSVIYTCRQSDFADSHFDTNHYPHIIYNDPNELRDKLALKIEAWIK